MELGIGLSMPAQQTGFRSSIQTNLVPQLLIQGRGFDGSHKNPQTLS